LDRFRLLLTWHIDETNRQKVLTANSVLQDDGRQNNHYTVNEAGGE